MYCIIWKYEVDPSNASKFEKEYGRNGSWFKFFEPCDEYFGTELLKCTNESSYTVIDRWASKSEYECFLKENEAAYDQLTDKLSGLFSSALKVGTYNIIR